MTAAWKPLRRATIPEGDHSAVVVKVAMEHWNVDAVEARRRLDAEEARCEYWINDLYQVEVRRQPSTRSVHLNIRRRDGAAKRDWRHFQAIKNQLIGAECEAVELYPAESRKVDTTNKYHLYGCTDPTFRFPFGFRERDVDYSADHNDHPGLRQRPAT